MATDDHQEIWDEFRSLVNMTPSELEKWLDSAESKEVGQKGETGGESVGHKSGHAIIEIKHTKKADLTDDQWAHMQKVIGYIKRHSKQKPKGDIKDTNWRYSLMNWGHDPLKD
ncbi:MULTISPECIES: DUF3140 domain-containing protein [Aureimonas]|uniref:DNA-binding protein n=1 Tax=Aureimonas ureilytica TaxID=401562 RepID=A0A175R7G4_9HYPH|nr:MULTISPECIES: DUF3140 domain-containing protein [Aureimonas]KTQ95150.1 DNA-binding protein [Aureimonas ureilytica]